jgi:hypothetical protein
MTNQFYLTLPSNSSFLFYPTNKTSKYTTQLSQRISLRGKWEIGLVEFHYPQAINNIYSKNNVVYITELKNKSKVSIKSGYNSIAEIINSINNIEEINKSIKLSLDGNIVKVIKLDGRSNKKITFHPDLASILGFDTDRHTNFIDLKEAKRPPKEAVGILNQIYVYCNIVEPQLVGDSRSSLLRMVHVNKTGYDYNAFNVVYFENPHYVPVLIQDFETIEIDLRDDTGGPVPFVHGTSCVKVHFRKILS